MKKQSENPAINAAKEKSQAALAKEKAYIAENYPELIDNLELRRRVWKKTRRDVNLLILECETEIAEFKYMLAAATDRYAIVKAKRLAAKK